MNEVTPELHRLDLVAAAAPAGLHNTGSPRCNRIWTFLQTPCMNLPLTRGAHGLPVGLQLVC
ncbi:MAG: hypothetical protein OXD47_05565, partial [Gammaproteobacteria bacterium]|nr:hypothetical protein [Gammaproteobacteria bacterium]